jgi:hypothetical protein
MDWDKAVITPTRFRMGYGGYIPHIGGITGKIKKKNFFFAAILDNFQTKNVYI